MPRRKAESGSELAETLAKTAGSASWCYVWRLPDRVVLMVDCQELAKVLEGCGFKVEVEYPEGTRLLSLLWREAEG
jgi:hypothetical protein